MMFSIVRKFKQNFFNKYMDWEEYQNIIARKDEDSWRKSVRMENKLIDQKLKRQMRS